MTVNEAGLEDGDELSLVWSDPFVEMARWTQEETMDRDLYVRIPAGSTSIDDWAFNGCTTLAKLMIPDSVTSIGKNAFQYCINLKEVVIPESVTRIGFAAFAGCTSLTHVEIPNSVTSIEQQTFSYCSFLTQVNIPNSVTRIGQWAFRLQLFETNPNPRFRGPRGRRSLRRLPRRGYPRLGRVW